MLLFSTSLYLFSRIHSKLLDDRTGFNRCKAVPAGLAIAMLVCLPAYAQSYAYTAGPGIRVNAVQDNSKNGNLVLKFDSAGQSARPNFRYLPGPDGKTILAADFEGFQLTGATRVIRSNAAGQPISEIHLGQLQTSPPVMRISFIAKDPAALKKVAVAAAPGVLKVDWPLAMTATGTPASFVAPPAQAPIVAQEPSTKGGWLKRMKKKASNLFSFDGHPDEDKPQSTSAASASSYGINPDKSSNIPVASSESSPPPIAPQALKAVAKPLTAPKIKVVNASQPATQAPPSADVLLAEPSQNPDPGPPPKITLEKADAQNSGAQLGLFRVEWPGNRAIIFKSFRLKSPERYVMDIVDARALVNAELPDVTDSPLVESIRVGIFDPVSGTGRLVLELKDESINCEETYNEGSSFMTLSLARGVGQGTIVRNGLPAGGPIVVPPAPRNAGETVIVVDAGHGGHDPGALRGNVQEKELTLGIAQKLKKQLEAKGARVVMTRSDDTFVSLEDRGKITNSVQPDVFISVHINSLESTSNIYGIETYFQTDKSRPLADKVHGSLVSGLAAPDRNVRKARFYVINHTPVPAILAEVGYITNKAERDRLISSDYQNKIASSLARGVMLYLQDARPNADIAKRNQPGQKVEMISGTNRVYK